jgi:hypothetical protein
MQIFGGVQPCRYSGVVYDPDDQESAGLTLLDTFALILSRRAEVFRFPVGTVSMRAAWVEHSRMR